MNKTILFSPLGGTDPISNTNCQDGALLHISRVYKPDEVYLYMSKEIIEFHEKDNRYIYCLDELAKLTGHKIKYHIIERRDLTDVHLFDYFYNDFRDIIKDIIKNSPKDSEILLNISSGTPAIKSALMVLTTLEEYPCRLIQVSTPQRRMNEHKHKDYDVQTLWSLNPDNEENFDNRCEEIHCPSLSKIKQEEIIKKLVRVYDYPAAMEVAKTLENTKTYEKLLEIACARLEMDLPKLNALTKTIDTDIIPIKSGNSQKYFEYALNMDIKRKKGEYADFVRAITPLIVDVFALMLKNVCKIDISELTYDHPPKWDEKKLKLKYPDIDNLLRASFTNFHYGPIYSSALEKIILAYSSEDKLKNTIKKLRSVEQNVRNRAAHEIVSLSDKAIKNMTGFNAEEIMKLIKDAFRYTGLNITQKHWDSYDAMNAKIIAAMG